MEGKLLTVEDALQAANAVCSRSFDIKVIRGTRYTQCPESDHKDSYKIRLSDDGFSCIRCGTGGNVPSLFMHLVQHERNVSSGTEAARIMHQILDGDSPSLPARPKEVVESAAPEKTYEAADIEVRDRTYRTLLELLPLNSDHRSALRARGLSDEDIRSLGYKSSPRNPDQICKTLLQKGCILEGVPGFYKNDAGKWTLNVYGGILIPFRNAKGQIQFFQVRTDRASNGKRYFAVSSKDMEEGTGAKTWVHIHKGKSPEWWKNVCITEGALKADVASCLTGETFIAVAGVGNVGDLPRALCDLAYLGLEKVTLCYDMDKDKNRNVVNGENKIKRMLSPEYLDIPYEVCTWPGEYKGIDDYLYACKFNK